MLFCDICKEQQWVLNATEMGWVCINCINKYKLEVSKKYADKFKVIYIPEKKEDPIKNQNQQTLGVDKK